MATQYAKHKTLARKHKVAWPSERVFEQAAEYVRPGTDRHVAAAMMLSGEPTMEQIEAVLGSPHYNVVTALKKAGCKPVSGTDKDGYRVYSFTLPAKARMR